MAADRKATATRILNDPALNARQRAAQLLPLIYDQLRAAAQQQMSNERRGHTLQATALVHEAYARLIDRDDEPVWANRAHFFAAAAEAMRRILIDHARARCADKRGGGKHVVVSLEKGMDLADEKNLDAALILDDLISRLEKEDATAANVVRLRYFAGLSIEETAAALEIATATVKRNWTYARAWLLDAMQSEDRSR